MRHMPSPGGAKLVVSCEEYGVRGILVESYMVASWEAQVQSGAEGTTKELDIGAELLI